MPITVPAKYLYKGAKWTGQQLGIVSKGGAPSPEQVRLAKLRAARQRSLAAQARARAADAQTNAELRAQQAIEPIRRRRGRRRRRRGPVQGGRHADRRGRGQPGGHDEPRRRRLVRWVFDPGLRRQLERLRRVQPSIERPVGNPGPEESPARAAHEKKIIAKAAEKSATGIKIRSGAALYAKAHKGDKKAKAAIRTMVAKAKRGDQQAIADTRAVQAGRLAVLAREKAQKREAVALHRKARQLKVVALQKKLEARAATKLVRMERKHDLKKLATVERKAAAGSPRHRAYVAKQVADAKKGDTKAQKRVRAMQLAKSVRKAAPTARERRNLLAAQKLVEQAKKGNPKAVRQVRVIQAAARAGNPNAKRAAERLAVGAAIAAIIATGTVVLASDEKRKKNKKSRADHARTVADAKNKLAAGTASREELAAGSRSAQALGDKKTAGELAVAATNTPSATEQLKRTAPVVAAKEAGNEEAKKAIVDSLDAAKTGDPAAIQKTAKVVAVQTIDDLNKGQPISPAMRDAVNLNERAKAGDPTAIAEAQKIQEASTSPNPAPEATMAAVSLGAAVAMDKALAAKPKAKAEMLARVNPPLPEGEQTAASAEVHALVAKANDGTITPEEGVRGVRLAERINQPKLAAEIAAKAPPYVNEHPLSSLPDVPLAPIASLGNLFWESVRALTFSTRDPLANYRGGLVARSKNQSAVEPASSAGWSPFSYFRSAAPWIAPLASTAAAAASITNLISQKQHKGAPAPAAPTAPAAPAAPTTPVTPAAPAAEVKATSSQVPTTSEPDLSAISEGSATQGEVTVTEDEVNKMKAGLAQFKAAKWKQPYPIVIDTASFRDDISNNPTVTPEEKAIWNQLVQEKVVAVSSLGRRMRLNQKTRKPEIVLSGDAAPPTPEDVKSRIRKEIAEEGILPPTPAARGKKKGESSTLGADKSFKDYVMEAVRSKKMSRDDFNSALEAHLGKDASKEKKVASGEKILKFLAGKGVKVET